MKELLTVISLWLSVNFGMPMPDEIPRVEYLSSPQMGVSWYVSSSEGKIAGWSHRRILQLEIDAENLRAFYFESGQTIFLDERWRPQSIADVSVLVHEVVHHLQSRAGLHYRCPAAREKLAYQAQSRWLELHGLSLESEFGLDGMTVLVRSNCMDEWLH
jgi:hypothetical protein